MSKEGICCNPPTCVSACPTHVAKASYSAVVGAHTMTLLSPDHNCNFIGSSCIVDTPTVTNEWIDTYIPFTFSNIFTCRCNELDCCNGSQVPGEERAPATRQVVQTAYEQKDKWKRWEQFREEVTTQILDAGGGNLRILVTVLKEILYMVGANTLVRGGYRVATITYCTPSYTEGSDPPVIPPPVYLPAIQCSIAYDAPVWDAWPAHPDPNYPPCFGYYFYVPSHPDCEFVVGPAVAYVPTLETDIIGPFNRSVCIENVCVSSTYSTQKVKTRLYELNCGGEFTYGGLYHVDCYHSGPGDGSYRAFGYYYYYSDPFPCNAFPANPIALKREPYTDIAASTNNVTICNQTFPYRIPATSKDLTITIT